MRSSNANTCFLIVLVCERKETQSLFSAPPNSASTLGPVYPHSVSSHVFHTEVPQAWLKHRGFTMLLMEMNSSHALFLSLYFEDHLRCLLR